MDVKVGLKLKNGDLGDIIISLIFKTEKEFTISDIVDLTMKYLDCSKIPYSKEELKKRVDKKLVMLENENYVKCANGVYTTVRSKDCSLDNEVKFDLGIL